MESSAPAGSIGLARLCCPGFLCFFSFFCFFVSCSYTLNPGFGQIIRNRRRLCLLIFPADKGGDIRNRSPHWKQFIFSLSSAVFNHTESLFHSPVLKL